MSAACAPHLIRGARRSVLLRRDGHRSYGNRSYDVTRSYGVNVFGYDLRLYKQIASARC